MAKYGEHLTQLKNYFENTPVKVETSDHFTVFFKLDETPTYKVQRSVRVSEINANDEFTIELTAHEQWLDFVTYQYERRFKINNEKDVDRAYYEMTDFFNHPRYLLQVPTAAAVVTMREINKDWLSGQDCAVELYMANNEGINSEWRYRIATTGKNRVVIVEHLDPTHAHGHTYRMLMSAVCEAARRAHITGLREATEEITRQQFRQVFVSGPFRLKSHEVPFEINHFVKGGSLRMT